ncbi:hypothetical protein RB628_19490 [Streptomyces sp. ADMS]|uniref:hypothetical protein n=1 Tax=Streptomyces sp. ADMS TaxID=3071415 RepID=UPI00296F5670|nr:hypothetical protein [Streptomyces sp. ADMS]MDW4907471.1 hypothetical protein [Streptomyces sp. ADMS]
MDWTEAYTVEQTVLPATGYVVSDDQTLGMAPTIQELLTDSKGVEEVRRSLESITRTDFDKTRLEAILHSESEPESWRVGEALAEYHLASECFCFFPWPSGRDLKNPGTSSGGVDLIGFEIKQSGETALALAEVKTSEQEKSPPDLMQGRHGMKGQLEGLRSGDNRKLWAIKYLGMHAQGKDWFQHFQKSMVRYFADPTDVRLYGTLVRTVSPNVADLRARARSLAKDCPSKTKITLTAIYVTPQGMEILAGAQVAWETSP